jgi:hypothetical protein
MVNIIPYSKNSRNNVTGILRETQISQFYRYTQISQLWEARQFCRYVGDNKDFSNAKMVVIFKDTYSPA